MQSISHAPSSGCLVIRVLHDGVDPATGQGGGAAEGRELQPDGQQQQQGERIEDGAHAGCNFMFAKVEKR